ncbi:hypothetical protein TNCV_2512831 [Trichonephila clavipes]|nr:hypothetical protein TNCV_2512831 [Trichonephila clavipes]
MPSEINQLMAREAEDKFGDYDYIKAKSCRDFVFGITSYFEEWLGGLGLNDFEELKNLPITDQLKRRVPGDKGNGRAQKKETENETRIREARHKEEEQARLKAEVEARLKAEEETKAVEERRRMEEERRMNKRISLEEEMRLKK